MVKPSGQMEKAANEEERRGGGRGGSPQKNRLTVTLMSALCHIFVITCLKFANGTNGRAQKESKANSHMYTRAQRCRDKETPCDFTRPTRSIGKVIHK